LALESQATGAPVFFSERAPHGNIEAIPQAAAWRCLIDSAKLLPLARDVFSK
jgi:hypothetical protein